MLITGIALLSSCTERIDIKLDSTYTQLAVEGYITPDTTKQYIRLTETAEYFSDTSATSVTGATVIVNNGVDDVIFSESPTKPGYYMPSDGFIADPGSTYTTTIDLEKPINGDSHFTANETMPAQLGGVDSISVEWRSSWEIWTIKFYAQEPPERNFYMFNVMVNGVMLTDSVQRNQISDDRLYNGSYTYGVMVQTLGADEAAPGDTVTLVMSNITKDYYNYMIELQDELWGSDPIFSGPPANVSTNINNNAVGYIASFTNTYVSGIVKSKEYGEK